MVRACSRSRVLLALWLLLTRSGRLALAAAQRRHRQLAAALGRVVGDRDRHRRRGRRAGGDAGDGRRLQRRRWTQTGSDDTAIVLRGGSQAETNSVLTRDQVPLIAAARRASRKDANGKPIASPELSQVVPTCRSKARRHAMPTCSCAAWATQAWAVRPQGARSSKAASSTPGLRELVVGQGAQRAVPRPRGRPERRARQPAVDGRRRVRLRRFARFGTVGRRRRRSASTYRRGSSRRSR